MADFFKDDYELNEEEKKSYQRTVGKLLYIARFTRPDLTYAASFLGRFASKPAAAQLEALVQV